jgi:hypothetical protein
MLPHPPAQAASRLRAFIQRYTDVLDPGTTVGLLAGYGRLDELQHYARCRGDWEGLLGYLLQRGEVRGVLVVRSGHGRLSTCGCQA